MQVGTDEAGKGPVLGSMFAAVVRADPDGLADSEQLSASRRERPAARDGDDSRRDDSRRRP